MKRIIVIGNHFSGNGGAQKEMIGLANQLAMEGYQISILSLTGKSDIFYTLSNKVHISHVDLYAAKYGLLNFGLCRWISRIMMLRRFIGDSNADTLISFSTETNLHVLAASRFMSKNVIITEVNDFRNSASYKARKHLMRLLYPRANFVTANGTYLLRLLGEFVAANKLKVTRKPYTLPRNIATPPQSDKFSILAVGRVDFQKGYDVLLKGLKRLDEKIFNWRLDVLGDGPLKSEMEILSGKLGLAGKVVWHGVKNNPGDYYMAASAFVLASRYEGVPNALLEAMGYGLPIVVSSVPGSLEYASHKKNSLVFPIDDHVALGDALLELVSSRELRTQLGKSARACAVRLSEVDTLAAWKAII